MICEELWKLENTRKILKLKFKNSKELWRAINLKKPVVSNDISDEEFASQFSGVNNPPNMENFRPQPVVSEFESWSTDEVGGTLYPELVRVLIICLPICAIPYMSGFFSCSISLLCVIGFLLKTRFLIDVAWRADFCDNI